MQLTSFSSLLPPVQVLLQVELCELFWKVQALKNVLAKSTGTSNPHNVVKATLKALSDMRDAKTVAKSRGISMSKVFNG